MEYSDVTTECYENEVPAFVEAEMERLYENLFSSIAQFRVYGADVDASTYVVRKNGVPSTILLFREEAGRVQVINEVIRIDEEEMSRFARYIFSTVKGVTVISFNAIQTNVRKLPFPYMRMNCLEDIVLTLPQSADEYMTSLGKATRKTIKGYGNKLKRDFPSFSYKVYSNEELTEQQVRDIITLNKARMAEKNKVSAYDEHEIRQIVQLAKECGLVGVITIDGVLRAGAISYRIGKNYFMRVNAHDPAYDDYRLGTLCSFLIISSCISRGGRECHLLWGEHEYKYRFLGVRRDLDALDIYRSHLHMLRNGDKALKRVAGGCVRQAELWLHAAKKNDGLAWRALNGVVYLVRYLKRFMLGLSLPRKKMP